MAFVTLVLSLPVLDLLFPGKPAEARRQVFAISCIYASMALAVGVIENAKTLFAVSGKGFDFFFNLIQQIGMTVIMAGVTISFLFFLLTSIMYGLRVVTKTSKEWIV
jgi:hypothetical protein